MTEVRWLCDTGMLGQLLEFITGYVGYVFGLGQRLTPMQWRLVWRSWNHNPCMSFSPLAYLKNTYPNHQLFVPVSGRGSVLFGRQWNTSCASSFVCLYVMATGT